MNAAAAGGAVMSAGVSGNHMHRCGGFSQDRAVNLLGMELIKHDSMTVEHTVNAVGSFGNDGKPAAHQFG